MPKITYIEATGARHPVDVDCGRSLMEGAVENHVPGVLGDCGGAAACATCRVYIDADWRARTGEASELELAMLDPDDVRPGQRLGCQIKVADELDGLVVSLPERQF